MTATSVVTFVVDGKRVEVLYEGRGKGSNYVKDIIECFGQDNEITFPSNYLSVANNYLSYLKGIKITVDKDELDHCFELASYFDDDEYFRHLINYVCSRWYEVASVVIKYSNRDLRRKMFLYLPYSFLPEESRYNQVFFQEWLQLNENSKIGIENPNNGKITEHSISVNINEDGIKTTHIYSKVGEQIIGHERMIKKKGNYITLDIELYNRVKHGFCRQYHENSDIIADESYYVDDERHGHSRSYYKNGNIRIEGEYVNGTPHGLWRVYYENKNENGNENGKVLVETEFDDGERTSTHREYYESGRLREEGNYKMDYKFGEWRSWYDAVDEEGKQRIATVGIYYDNRKYDTWKEWFEDGEIKSEGPYYNDVKVGSWKECRMIINNNQGGQITVMSSGKYSQGVKIGHWIIVDTKGNFIGYE